MNLLRTSVATVAGLLAVAAVAEERMFEPPMHAGYRIDVCRVWGYECGQPAADEFCRQQGFERADFFSVDDDIGAATPTRTLADGKVCDQGFCDGFGAINCVRADAAPQSGAPPSADPQRPGRLKLPGSVTSSATSPNDPPPAQPGQSPPTSALPPWTPKDVMRPNVDVQAQYALFRMLKRAAPAWRKSASTILSALHAGALKGIYQEDQQVPALRAQKVGKWWKQIIPSGYASATCMKEPAGQAPILVVRKGTPSNHEEYDAWLTLAWDECGIEANWPERAYDPSAPGDPPATGTMQHCKGAEGMAAALHICQDLHQRSVAQCKQRYLLDAAGDQSMADVLEIAGGQPSCLDKLAPNYATCQQDAYARCR